MNYCLQEAGFPPLLIAEPLYDEYNEALNSYTVGGLNLEPMRLLLREATKLCRQDDICDILAMTENEDEQEE